MDKFLQLRRLVIRTAPEHDIKHCAERNAHRIAAVHPVRHVVVRLPTLLIRKFLKIFVHFFPRYSLFLFYFSIGKKSITKVYLNHNDSAFLLFMLYSITKSCLLVNGKFRRLCSVAENDHTCFYVFYAKIFIHVFLFYMWISCG